MKIRHIATALSVVALCSCSSNQWKVTGNISEADGKTIVLEAADNGYWYPLDSVKLDNSGNFSISQPAAGYPDIYRLRLDKQSLYFPIDSIETITIKASASSFDNGYELSGSTSAQMLMDVERKINQLVNSKGVDAAINDSILKRELGGMILGDPAGIVTYYIISKNIAGKPLYNPNDKHDVRIIGAVANAFDQYRPNDPRTRYLKQLFLSNRPRPVAPTDTVYAEETPIFEINLMDEKGKAHSLTELSQQGKVILLNFTVYDVEASVAYNIELARIYEKLKDKGFEIYQVSVDPDEFKWRQSAKNLPWITVYNSSADGSENLIRYNVTNLPTAFIIDRKGELVERIDNVEKLESTINKYL